MSFKNLELPCIFVPEGGKLPAIPCGDPAIFPAIFIPDSYQGPRPGYPWIEFGRMTLRVDRPRQAASAATAAGTRQSASDRMSILALSARPDPLGRSGPVRRKLCGGEVHDRRVSRSRRYGAELDTASTYLTLDEAARVIQDVLDANRDQVRSWLADPDGGRRLVIGLTRPAGSRRYVPIGVVLSRGASVPVPGSGARVVLQRTPSPRGFIIVTSFPTFPALSPKD